MDSLEVSFEMENSMSKLLVGSIVKRTLKEMNEDPDRGIWNLVDMALQFSDGRFQEDFFTTTQTMEAGELCSKLRDLGLLYSAWVPYGQKDLESITNGNLFYSVQQLSPSSSASSLRSRIIPTSSLKSLQTELQKLQDEQQRLYDERAKLKKQAKQIDTIKANVDIFLNLNPVEEQQKEQASERG